MVRLYHQKELTMNDNTELDNELLERETARIMKAMSEEDDEEAFLQEQFPDFDVDDFRGLDEDTFTKQDYVRLLVYDKMVLAKEEISDNAQDSAPNPEKAD